MSSQTMSCHCAEGDIHAMFYGATGVALAIALSSIGAGIATAESSKGIGEAWVRSKTIGMRALLPVVMAGIIGIYGLVVGVVIANKLQSDNYTYAMGFSHFMSGLCTGGCSLGAGYAVGVSGDVGARSLARKGQNFVGFVLIWAWAQLLGLYGLLVSLVMAQ